MNLKDRISYFFSFTLPDLWDRFTYWLKHGNRIYVMSFFFLIFMIPIVGIQSYWTYENCKEAESQRNHIKTENVSTYNNHVLDGEVLKGGAAKYLRDELLCKTNKQVIAKFNNNEQYQGRYDVAVSHANSLGKNINDFRNYLNPIINEIQDGQSVKEAKINKNFKITNPQTTITDNQKNNGVLIIGWNSNQSNAQQEADQISKIVKDAKNYSVVVYDTKNQDGQNAFSLPFWTTIQNLNTGKFNDGFNKQNAWTGVAYGFENGILTYHTKDLNGIPNNLPTASIADN